MIIVCKSKLGHSLMRDRTCDALPKRYDSQPVRSEMIATAASFVLFSTQIIHSVCAWWLESGAVQAWQLRRAGGHVVYLRLQDRQKSTTRSTRVVWTCGWKILRPLSTIAEPTPN